MKEVLQSFKYAIEGIVYVFQTQQNMKIHFAVSVFVLLLSVFLDVSTYQLLFVFSSIVLVMCMELMNTAVEKVVDLITEDYHQNAKIAKDVAAGAVLFAALFATIIGVYVFIPPIVDLLSLPVTIPVETIMITLVLIIFFLFWLKKRKG
ncbi:diacylglycerol kinase family protein [Caldalkalibacillus salinus]|uniref:diacylglycerol kinase family protein n=1 Tax=Caldalkalibacillus salinus TaxID=2803787 RepID=UPI001924B69E|nr:diacylglycerol kinase family protein [Caldalkalibacillus salinus]